MFRDVTFGQYYPANSFVHNMDSRAKLVLCLLFMVGIFFVTSFAVFGLITVFLIVAIKVLFVYHADNAVDIIVVYRQAGISFAVKGLFNLAKRRVFIHRNDVYAGHEYIFDL